MSVYQSIGNSHIVRCDNQNLNPMLLLCTREGVRVCVCARDVMHHCIKDSIRCMFIIDLLEVIYSEHDDVSQT
jgi:hypothetical protein